jgi:hypothetical protein
MSAALIVVTIAIIEVMILLFTLALFNAAAVADAKALRLRADESLQRPPVGMPDV